MSETKARSQYEKHGIDPRYDDTGSYGPRDSFYGDGKYPPDWDSRRDAVWERQKYQCARCRVYKGDADRVEVHHVVHLDDGGQNHLENLVGLCQHCHALMHPGVDVIRGRWEEAPVYPHGSADDRVSAVRVPDDAELETDLRNLSRTSEPTENRHAITSATVPTDPADARRARTRLDEMLYDRGYVPRTTDYHAFELRPTFRGVRGLFTPYEPRLRASTDGRLAVADDWSGRTAKRCEVRCAEDASTATVTLEDALGESVTEELRLDGLESGGIGEAPLAPPPLGVRTAPGYAYGALWRVGADAAKWGLLPAALVALAAPGLLPFGGSLPGVVGLALLIGVVVTLVAAAKRVDDPPDCAAAVEPSGD